MAQFSGEKYLNLETFKKSRKAVQTPVWFVEDNGVLYVRTMQNSGKVKRMRNNPHVRVAPCSFRGRPRGVWVDGEAHIADAAESERANQLFNRKYGLQKRFDDFIDKFRKSKRVVVAIRV